MTPISNGGQVETENEPLYVFVRSNPVSFTDHLGLDCPGCDNVPDIFESPAVLECCAEHDRCYDEHNCNARSWLQIICPILISTAATPNCETFKSQPAWLLLVGEATTRRVPTITVQFTMCSSTTPQVRTCIIVQDEKRYERASCPWAGDHADGVVGHKPSRRLRAKQAGKR